MLNIWNCQPNSCSVSCAVEQKHNSILHPYSLPFPFLFLTKLSRRLFVCDMCFFTATDKECNLKLALLPNHILTRQVISLCPHNTQSSINGKAILRHRKSCCVSEALVKGALSDSGEGLSLFVVVVIFTVRARLWTCETSWILLSHHSISQL